MSGATRPIACSARRSRCGLSPRSQPRTTGGELWCALSRRPERSMLHPARGHGARQQCVKVGGYKSGRWVNGHGVLRGCKAFIRKNVSASVIRKAEYPALLLVSLIYHEKAADGLPGSAEELSRLDEAEETVADRLCERHHAQFALCVTTDGTRDLFLFLPQRPDDDEVARLLDSCSLPVDYDFAMQHDPGWRPYMTMLPEVGEASAGRLPWWRRFFGA